ncbi:MAG: c-type cytochrome domain-containing protein [Verrucomicrobiales bacterium]
MKKTSFFVLAITAFTAQASAADKVDFTKSVKPILEGRCIECHGAKKEKGDLRLDTKAAAMKEGAKTIVSGDPDASDLIKRVALPPGHDDIMPPKGDPLSKEEIEVLKAWIKEGATWPEGVTLGEGEKKGKVSEFDSLTPAKDPAAETEAIKKLSALGISVRPIAQNMDWKEANIRPQDTNNLPKIMEQLKAVETLVEVNLANQKVKDEDLAHIAGLKNLLKLHLENTPVTDAGMQHLKGLSNLRYLNLYNTSVTDAGIANLKEIKNLERLYLWQSKVTDAGAKTLKEANPNLYVNRGEELTLVAKVEEKKEAKPEEKKEAKPEEKKAPAEEAKKEVKPEEKKEAKPEEKKAPAEEVKKEVKAEEKKEAKPEEKKEEKPEEKKA